MGGSTGTTTTTQNSTPFNSSQILDVQNKAVDLSNTNPFQYYPNQTFAPANTYQNQGYTGAGELGINAGNLTSGLVPNAQYDAITANQNLAAGGGVDTMMPWINSLLGLSSTNPAAAGMDA